MIPPVAIVPEARGKLKWEIFFSALLPLYLLLAAHGGRPGRLVLTAVALIAIAADVSDYLTFVLVAVPVALLGAEVFYRAIEHPAHKLARRVRTSLRDRTPGAEPAA